MPGPIDLHDVALDILGAAADALDTIPLTTNLDGAPDRQYVSDGTPAGDCPLELVVWVDPIGALPTRDTKMAAYLTGPSFNIRTARCRPEGKMVGTTYVPPSPAEITESARQHNTDAWALWVGLHQAVANHVILAECDEAFFDPMVAREPMGGSSGWDLVIRVTLHAYSPDDIPVS